MDGTRAEIALQSAVRQRFSILFVITLALSVASLLEHIKFALDAGHAAPPLTADRVPGSFRSDRHAAE